MTTFNGTDITGGTIHGTDITEMTANGNVVFGGGGGSSSDFYLDAQAFDDNVDYSSHGLTISPGQTFLCWMRVYQLGSSSAAHYPGIFSGPTGGGWDNFFEIYSDAGSGALTSGTQSARFAGETVDGSWTNSNVFNVDLDNNPWMLVGFTFHSDASLTYWLNDGTVNVNANNATTGDAWDLGYLGYAYAGEDNGSSGGKDFDTVGVWDRELGSSEVTGFYGSAAIPDSPLHLWEFEDDSNTTATDTAGTADGTISGATYVSGGAY